MGFMVMDFILTISLVEMTFEFVHTQHERLDAASSNVHVQGESQYFK
jgi:hypothetical protein